MFSNNENDLSKDLFEEDEVLASPSASPQEIREPTPSPARMPQETRDPTPSAPGPRDPFIIYFRELELPSNSEDRYLEKVYDLCKTAEWRTKRSFLRELDLLLLEILPPRETPGKQQDATPPTPKNRRERKKAEYKRLQDLWRKDKVRCIKRILNEDIEQHQGLPREVMEPYWTATFTLGSRSSPVLSPPARTFDGIWAPLRPIEVKGMFPPNRTAKGPDGVAVKDLKKISLLLLTTIFNLFMYCGALPERLCASRTIFIPKVNGADNPKDFRPITVTSVLVRTFHKVLAGRLKVIPLEPRQRGFREVDVCAENITLLDLLLRYYGAKHRKVFFALLDMAKAFDTVSHEAIKEVLRHKGVPQLFINYLMRNYSEGFTKLQHGGWESEKIYPQCGVKQGDPLSPIIFNFVMDEMLKILPEEIGARIDSMKFNAMAFADDLNLVASTEDGLQQLINIATSFLGECGLRANPAKCRTGALKTVPKEKRVYIDPKCRFKIDSATIPSIDRLEEWTYLGVSFNSGGRILKDAKPKLIKNLELLSKAPLKPQQRLWALRTVVVPGLLYRGALGASSGGYLKKIDTIIRQYARRWLHLPMDCPVGYFHASVKDGGLGIHSIRTKSMIDRVARLDRLRNSELVHGIEGTRYLDLEISKAEQRLKNKQGRLITDKASMEEHWRLLLYESFDGRPLSRSSEVDGQHRWIGEPTRLLSGRDYVNCVKARINAMPTASRTARGRLKDKNCRAGCPNIETLNHVLQICHRTYGARIKRHNAVVDYVAKKLRKKGYEVWEEPKVKDGDVILKPDLIVAKDNLAQIIDAQVIGEQRDLDLAHNDKIIKYGSSTRAVDEIVKLTGCANIGATSITLNWRGLWGPESASDLLNRKIITNQDIKIMSTRVLVGAVAGMRVFNEATGVYQKKTTPGERNLGVKAYTTRDIRRWFRKERTGIG